MVNKVVAAALLHVANQNGDLLTTFGRCEIKSRVRGVRLVVVTAKLLSLVVADDHESIDRRPKSVGIQIDEKSLSFSDRNGELVGFARLGQSAADSDWRRRRDLRLVACWLFQEDWMLRNQQLLVGGSHFVRSDSQSSHLARIP